MSISKESFLGATEAWLESKSYRVGVGEQGVNATKAVWATRITLGVLKLGLHAAGVKLPASQVFHPVSGGADAQKIEKALAPLTPLSDVLGWSIAPMTLGNGLFAFICADALSPQGILERTEQMMNLAPNLANLGIKVKGKHSGLHLRVVLAYFDDRICCEHFRLLEAKGTRSKRFAMIWLRTGFLSIPQRTVKWTEPPGLRILTFNAKDPLSGADVEQILSAAENASLPQAPLPIAD